MATTSSVRQRYVMETVQTLAPSRLVVMLYDRLTLDLERAEAAATAGDVEGAHSSLVHAQEIVSELHDSLDTERWAPAQQLELLYRFLLDELVVANLRKDPARIATCRRIVEPLREAWSEAAGMGPGATVANGAAG